MVSETVSNANSLLREGNYAEAISVYRKLSIEQETSRYKANITYAYNRLVDPSIVRPSVIFVTGGLKGPTPGGGIATCFYNMIECLSERDVDVTVLYIAHPYYGKGNYGYWKEKYERELGITFKALNANTADYGSKEMKRSNTIKNFLLTLDGCFDRAVFHDFNGLAYYSLLAKARGLGLSDTELVVSAHGNHKLSYYFGSKKIANWSESANLFLERQSLLLADRVTTPSQYYADWLRDELGVDDAIHMENIIDIGPLPDKSEIDIELDPQRTTIFFYGRVERLKGIDVLVGAMKELSAKGHKVNLCLVGNKTKIDGVESDSYVLSALEGLDIRIKFIYNVSAPDFFRFVKEQGGVVVFPTLGETSSCVVVEAIQAEVPFVASDIPGIKELVAEEFHGDSLFKAGCQKSLLNALERAVSTGGVPPAKLSFDMDENKERWAEFLMSKEKIRAINDAVGEPLEGQLVSVVIPTADRPELLRQSIETILSQTYRNIEIIVYDDCSELSAENRKVCESLGVDYYLSEVKLYKGRICNIATKVARGSFVCFFDDDDLAKPGMIERYAQAFSRDSSLDVVSCFADVFEHSEYTPGSPPPVKYISFAIGNDFSTNILANFFGKGTFIVRKEAFETIGGYEVDQDPVPMVDYRFYIKASLRGLNIGVIPDSLYYYRKNSPKSLFYENKNNKRMQYLAKLGITKVIEDAVGEHIAPGLNHTVWNISLPNYGS